MKLPKLNQSPVTFDSESHRYFLGEKELQGITSTLVHRAFPDTYKKPDKYTQEEWDAILANAAAKGSNMHETIELYDELGAMSDLPELQSYIRIKEENNLTVLASEYLVSDEEHYATAIDKVLMNPEGEIILVDLKRTSQIHLENVTCQLSICKRFFERQNPKLKVGGIYLLWLRDEKSKFQKLHPWADEELDLLIQSDLSDNKFDITATYGDLPAVFADVEEEVAKLERAVKIAQGRQKELKDGLYALMEKSGVKSWKGSIVTLTRVLPSESNTFDAKAFEEENPELYKKYVKKVPKKGSIRITLTKK